MPLMWHKKANFSGRIINVVQFAFPLWNYASSALDIDPLGLGIKEDGVKKWSKRVRHTPLVMKTYILVRTMNV